MRLIGVLGCALVLAGCHARLDDAPGSPAPITIDLNGAWQFSSDANQSAHPTAVVSDKSSTSVSVSYEGIVSECGCSAQHLQVSLPRELECQSAVLTFHWSSFGVADDSTHSTGLRVDFSDRGVPTGELLGTGWVGPSNCAWNTNNQFDAPPLLQVGDDEIQLGHLLAKDGHCDSRFDTIDLHVEGYSCSGTSGATLSNVSLR